MYGGGDWDGFAGLTETASHTTSTGIFLADILRNGLSDTMVGATPLTGTCHQALEIQELLVTGGDYTGFLMVPPTNCGLFLSDPVLIATSHDGNIGANALRRT